VAGALCRARARGVDVKIVTESDTFLMKGSFADRFRDEGIEAVRDECRGLMHNKFAVVDGKSVWTGSYNPTPKGSGLHDENALLIHSAELASIYTAEFMEMFRDGVFGNRSEPGPFSGIMNRHHVRIGESDINVYFSPEDDVERIIIGRLRKAQSSIHFMAYSFTSEAIGEMMIRRHREGVDVRGVFERRGAKAPHGEFMKMKIEGVPVKLDRNRHAMHHKVIVIDGRRVITGSFNFSRNAARKNDENILVIDNQGIAAAYQAEFNRLYR
jgi:phosphatidylserine/phosphatidylglycerophosphate/cardiolipin synthase-like enzyme